MGQVIQAASAASGVPAQAAGGAQMTRPAGPVVRVTRGKTTIDVPVEKGQ
jgi:hypothetical protein